MASQAALLSYLIKMRLNLPILSIGLSIFFSGSIPEQVYIVDDTCSHNILSCTAYNHGSAYYFSDYRDYLLCFFVN